MGNKIVRVYNYNTNNGYLTATGDGIKLSHMTLTQAFVYARSLQIRKGYKVVTDISDLERNEILAAEYRVAESIKWED